MKVINYSDFRKDLATHLNDVEANDDVLIVSRTGGRNVVVISMEAYESLTETDYLLSTKANRTHLQESIEQYKKGDYKEFQP